MRLSLWAARVLFFFLFALVTFLTLTPDPENTEPGFVVTRWISAKLFGSESFADKVAHFLGYGALGASVFWADLKLFSRRLGAGAALCVYGVLLEVLQGLGGVRSPEVADAVCNMLGAAAGLGGACILSHLVGGRRSG